MDPKPNEKVLIIGGGPAGLAAAYRLGEGRFAPIVLEKRDKVGGLSCTEAYKGFLFDMGGHRFYSKNQKVNEIWRRTLEEDFLLRRRLSRIYYKGKFLHYPLKPLDALTGMGPLEAFAVALSYFRWRLFPYRSEENFERWVINRFGRRLYRIFFKSYTEKVWGIPCTEISSVWAAQRIRDLSLKRAVAKMLSLSKRHLLTLISEFHYPRKGPSMMWNALKDSIESKGGTVLLGREASILHREGFLIKEAVVSGGGGGMPIAAKYFISSMPLTSLVKKLDPPPPAEVLEAAGNLRYRDFITICLIVDRPDLFPDQWIYVQDPHVRMGRIQNYKNWSTEMVPDSTKTGLGLEYFCTAGDDLWNLSDEELLHLGRNELERMGLIRRGDVIDGTVFRIPKAYPLYEKGYDRYLKILREFVVKFENLQSIGRNGLFRYDDMDHSMLSGILAADNLTGVAARSVWSMKEGEEYLEDQGG